MAKGWWGGGGEGRYGERRGAREGRVVEHAWWDGGCREGREMMALQMGLKIPSTGKNLFRKKNTARVVGGGEGGVNRRRTPFLPLFSLCSVYLYNLGECPSDDLNIA